MPANHTLGAITLRAGLIWTDEFDWQPVQAVSEYGVTGALIIDIGTRQSGRPITLQRGDDSGWTDRATLQSLVALAANAGATHTFTHADGRVFTVMFAPDGDPITARPVTLAERPPADFPYAITLRLIEV